MSPVVVYGVCLVRFILISFMFCERDSIKEKKLFFSYVANSKDTGSATSDHVLHYLQVSLLWHTRLKWVIFQRVIFYISCCKKIIIDFI